ncbi:LppP/LprE family lipoprotein [Corynebacterium urealyticum]|uniref:LppP/LprE family lipoprotein n=1 Tax=Corynebacterium urealyticum TaxID=43771 RepID=UPI0021CC9698|nr:LppP/LprE family lipoprotein [Corynebacterium urealyticum]
MLLESARCHYGRGPEQRPWTSHLGTATPEPRSFAPDMKLLNTQTVSVTYYYAKPGDPKDQPSGRAHVNFIWDHAKKKVIMDGNLPPRG